MSTKNLKNKKSVKGVLKQKGKAPRVTITKTDPLSLKTARIKNTPKPKRSGNVTRKKQVTTSSQKTKGKEFVGINTEENNTSPSVKLPLNMGIRTVGKSVAMRLDIDEYIRKSIYLVAYVSAICFVLVGATAVIFEVNFPNTPARATVIETTQIKDSSTSGSDTLTASESIKETETILEATKFEFLTTVPMNIVENFNVNFVATNAKSIKAKLVRIGFSDRLEMRVDTLLENKYRVILPVKDIAPGYYELRIYIEPKNGASTIIRSTKEFFIGSDEVERKYNFDSKSLDTNKEEVTSAEEELNIDISASSSQTDLESNDFESPLIEKQTPYVEGEERATISTSTSFSIINNFGSTLTGTVYLSVSAPLEYTPIELYARPLNSLQTRFVTTATKRQGNWVFNFNTKNIPNGQYELIGRTNYESVIYETKSLKVTIKNFETPSFIASTSATSSGDSINEIEGAREFLNVESLDFDNRDTEVEIEVEKLLQSNLTLIDEALKRYATALQTGDAVLLEQSKNNLDELKKQIAIEAIENSETRILSDNIDKELRSKIEDLQTKTEEFEKIRKEKSLGQSSVDEDKDGVSDFDEISIYRTNPALADSDNDGVTDGIEIMGGFNPNDDSPEAVVNFESPKDVVGLERNDALSIESVSPIVTGGEEGGLPDAVRAEIKGRALPNSFVSIYIFSTPTVVTIKTDPDGYFVYTFEKELDDGEHEVYATMTNNSGAIMAQSKPFTFVKTAEAFTITNADTTESPVSNQIISDSRSTYNLVIGFSVLAFGLILLMLGTGLRTKEETVSTNTEREEAIIDQKALNSLKNLQP